MHAPPAAVGYATYLLDVEVDHVAGSPSQDLLRLAIRFAAWVDKLAPVELQLREDPADGSPAHADPLLFELEHDACSRPFVISAHQLDSSHDVARSRGGLPARGGRPVEQTDVAVLPVAVDPL
ncbi:hypothetical protein GSI01S_33_00570 [Gordonia sihwensis NBRC 108236]|uniref:Uncharacterized protein n=1 Tax=Gordonia sihwensis NBRC 108236 TaxID=1223544 RepID=L7LNR8_9ACTN|nr:hypothetical protein GSI01S_33_00570 [Gordonia sihwensis NBRC 108236]